MRLTERDERAGRLSAIGAETKVQDMRTLIGAVTWLCGAAALALCGCPKQGPAVAGLDPISVTRERIESAQLATPPRPPRERPVPAELAVDGPVDRLGLIIHGVAQVRDKPDELAAPISQCEPGDYIPILEARSGHAGVRMSDGRVGWITGRQVEVLGEPAVPVLREEDPPGRHLVVRAMLYLGVPYVWGGTSVSGMDCSGFVQKVFREEGRELPRVACDQARVGLPVVLGALEAGDRVYFQAGHEIDHTGIYMGDGRFIHASGSGGAVRIDDLFDTHWQRIYAGAMR